MTYCTASLPNHQLVLCPPQARLNSFCMRLGVVIEGHDDSELPEQMLLSVYLNQLDPEQARDFNPALSVYLADEANRTPPL